jgi:hypothetical protein
MKYYYCKEKSLFGENKGKETKEKKTSWQAVNIKQKRSHVGL